VSWVVRDLVGGAGGEGNARTFLGVKCRGSTAIREFGGEGGGHKSLAKSVGRQN